MPIKIGGYDFDGPFDSADALKNESGVYSILSQQHLLDCGESADVKQRVQTHDRHECWNANAKEKIEYAAMYCSEAKRMFADKVIRNKLEPPCGKQ
jgi:hypothetical protein